MSMLNPYENFEMCTSPIIRALERTWDKSKKKKWDCIYIAVDIHDTIVYGNYDSTKLPKTFCPQAKETLQFLSNRKDIVLFLYTCSHKHEIVKYEQFFKENGITFQSTNKNPAVSSNDLGCYDDKPYFNLLLDDKAGFDCETDWFHIYNWFHKKREYLY